MATLSTKDELHLMQRGIAVEKDIHGYQYTFSLQGVYWLLNYLHEHHQQGKKPGLTLSLLKNLANAPAAKDARALRVKAVELPVYSKSFFQLAFYLNGTPPRLLHNTAPLHGLSERFPFLLRSNAIASTEEAFWQLTEDEQKRLAAGEVVEYQ